MEAIVKPLIQATTQLDLQKSTQEGRDAAVSNSRRNSYKLKTINQSKNNVRTKSVSTLGGSQKPNYYVRLSNDHNTNVVLYPDENPSTDTSEEKSKTVHTNPNILSNNIEKNENIQQQFLRIVKEYYAFSKPQQIRANKKLLDVSNKAPHSDWESFALIPKHIPRILVVGQTRIGKSSLCNKMAGIYYKLIENDEDASIICDNPEKQLFETSDSLKSVTKLTSWAQVSFCFDCFFLDIKIVIPSFHN